MGATILTYLDPSSGSLIAQAVMGAVVAAGLAVRIFWHRILRILGIKKSPRPDIDRTQ